MKSDFPARYISMDTSLVRSHSVICPSTIAVPCFGVKEGVDVGLLVGLVVCTAKFAVKGALMELIPPLTFIVSGLVFPVCPAPLQPLNAYPAAG